ncbi:MAG: transporter permease [Chloroflexi bacterium]|jgi:peptide/nickel transport system permease protein|nr:transporter permease [Chloroflexota bacterium]
MELKVPADFADNLAGLTPAGIPPGEPAQAESEPVPVSRGVALRGRLNRNRTLVLGIFLVGGLLLLAILGPFLAQFDPNSGNISDSLVGPSPTHLFGTDYEGRDMFTRVLYGARIAMGISVGCVVVSMIVGTLLGLLAAYVGGVVGSVIMRILDIVISFPYVVLVIAVLAVLGPGLFSVAVAIAAVDWTSYGRIIYGQVLSVREREFVESSRSLGASPVRIMLRHILPNVATPAVVYATLDISQVILLMSALSFLGLGAQPPTSDWGTMIADGRVYIYSAWWITTFPGLMIMLTGTSFAILGDGLADAMNRRR